MTFEQVETTSFIITMIAITGLLLVTCYVRIRRRLDEIRFAKLEEEARLIALEEEKEDDTVSSPRPPVPKEPEIEKASKIAVFDLFFPKTGPMELLGGGQEPHLIRNKESSPHGPASEAH